MEPNAPRPPRTAACCGPAPGEPEATDSVSETQWVIGTAATPAGPVPRVAVALGLADRLGAWRARWGVGRMRYRVAPGLYAVGEPTAHSPVLVSANYKLSFDRLRSSLAGRDVWLLVLDTRGINVWCAAGAGTFGTDELVARTEAVGLAEVVSHRRLIVPQLGAPGVAAHEVKTRSGFRVVYGPVRAEDLPAFLEAGLRATAEMRRVRFPIRDRLAVVPMELVGGLKVVLAAAGLLVVLGGLGPDGYALGRAASVGGRSAALLAGAYLAGAALTPLMLPWLPGRAFAAKGAFAGLALALALEATAFGRPGPFDTPVQAVAWLFIIPAVASFLAMNFTGASTYTSLSGVRREMRFAVPLQVVGAVLGLALWVAGRFVSGG